VSALGLEALKKGIELRETGGALENYQAGFTKRIIVKAALA
jgi:hypothetical protein